MRTVQVGMGWFPEECGGLNRYFFDLVRYLPGVGVQVTGLVAGSAQVEATSGGAVRAFAPLSANLPARLTGLRRLARAMLSRNDPGLLVTHFALYAVPCLGLTADAPLVVHFHGPWADESRVEGGGELGAAVKLALERLVYRRAERFIVLSRAFGRLLEQRYAVPPEKIRVVPGGVDSGRFSPVMSRREARDWLGWPTDRPVVLVVRRLTRRMGLETLIAAVREIREQVPDLLVQIAGLGPLAEALQAQITASGVSRQVRLLGYLPDAALPLAYRAADLSLVPSTALEGFGLIVAESLAAGTPVLVTDVGGLPEVIEDLCPDCIVPETGAAALGAALSRVLRGDIELPDEAACAEYARQRFDWGVVAARVARVYREVAS